MALKEAQKYFLFVFEIKFNNNLSGYYLRMNLPDVEFTQYVVSLFITFLRADNYNFVLIRRYLQGKLIYKACVIYVLKKALTDVQHTNLLLLLLLLLLSSSLSLLLSSSSSSSLVSN